MVRVDDTTQEISNCALRTAMMSVVRRRPGITSGWLKRIRHFNQAERVSLRKIMGVEVARNDVPAPVPCGARMTTERSRARKPLTVTRLLLVCVHVRSARVVTCPGIL